MASVIKSMMAAAYGRSPLGSGRNGGRCLHSRTGAEVSQRSLARLESSTRTRNISKVRYEYIVARPER